METVNPGLHLVNSVFMKNKENKRGSMDVLPEHLFHLSLSSVGVTMMSGC